MSSNKFSRRTLLREHVKEMTRLFGKTRVARANIGWVDDDYSICSKIYPLPGTDEPIRFLMTAYAAGKYRHSRSSHHQFARYNL